MILRDSLLLGSECKVHIVVRRDMVGISYELHSSQFTTVTSLGMLKYMFAASSSTNTCYLQI